MEANFNVSMNEYLPLRDVVFNTLRQAILRGELKPGERLMEIQLANKLGVSRTPVREAIRKLELEGLVLMIPRKGAEVADISEKSLKDVLEVREALEELAARLACDKITKEGINRLKEAAQDFRSALKSNDITQMAEADVRFHDVICNATENQKLGQLLNNLREQMYRYRIEYLKDQQVYEKLLSEHEEIIRHIEKGEKDEAARVVSRHIENQAQAVTDVIRTKKN
ncbi:MAG TPA: GntR family transcriptional regulator [Candidatus Dorea merdavium]|nr:GntR family transcriptional regulator [Candidatus Dorea merdavium]